MAEKIVRVRRKRRIRSFPGIDTFPIFRHRISPARIAIVLGSIAVAVVLSMFLFSYGSKAYTDWRERNLIREAESMLAKKDYNHARVMGRKILDLNRNSLRAYQILA